MLSDYINLNHNSSDQPFPHRKTLIIAAAVIVFLLIIAIVIGVVVSNRTANRPSNSIDLVNYQEAQIDLPADLKTDLAAQLYYLLNNNFNLADVSSVAVSIRPDTYESSYEGNVHIVNFLADVDAYQQSYNISLSWSDDGPSPNPTSIECAPRNLSKYPDVVCHGMYYDSTSPWLYLPYRGQLSAGNQYIARYGYQDSYGRESVTISVLDCQDATKSDFITSVKDYLSSTGGLDVDRFSYQVTSNNCIIE